MTDKVCVQSTESKYPALMPFVNTKTVKVSRKNSWDQNGTGKFNLPVIDKLGPK